MDSDNEAAANAAALFAGSGEVRALARELDWSATPLGPTTDWSPALRTMVRSMFDSPFPICLWSGPQYALIYNDPYRRILAAKHPAALGQPGSSVWAEIWNELQPQFDGVRAGGEPLYFEDAPFLMARLEGGGTETAWFNYSLSALRDEDGSVAAVLNITPETTRHVLLERRLAEEQAALAMSEERLRLVIEGARDHVIFTTDPGGIITTWSAGAEAVLGWSSEEALGQSASMIFTEEDRAAGADVRELAGAAREGCAIDERWHLRRDGSRVFLNGSIRCPRMHKGSHAASSKWRATRPTASGRNRLCGPASRRLRSMRNGYSSPSLRVPSSAHGSGTYPPIVSR